MVAEAGYAIRDDGDGDLAVTVATPWRGWLGAYLLDVLVRHAAAEGVRNLQAEVLLENGPMLSLLRRRDPVALEHDNGVVRLSIGTTGPTTDVAAGRESAAGARRGRRPSVVRRACRGGRRSCHDDVCGPRSRGGHECPVLRAVGVRSPTVPTRSSCCSTRPTSAVRN